MSAADPNSGDTATSLAATPPALERTPAATGSSSNQAATSPRGNAFHRGGRHSTTVAGNSNPGNRGTRNSTPRFRGAVIELQDFVFCMPREQTGLKPYSEVRDQLGLYVNKTYPKVCTYFRPLFGKDGNTTEPEATIPDIPPFDVGPAPDAKSPERPQWEQRKDQYAAMRIEAIKSSTQTFMQHRSLLKSACESMFKVIFLQCSDSVQGTLREDPDFDTKEAKGACQ